MKISRIFIIAFFVIALIAAVGIPTKPQIQVQNGNVEVFMAGRNVNMVAGTTLPDGDPYLQRQNEPSLAVSSRNPLHLLAGANDYRTVDMPIVEEELPGIEEMMAADAWLGYYTSDDGGESWKTALLPGFPQDISPEGQSSPLKAFTTAADPWVCAGSEGRFYYSGLAFNRGDKDSAIFVARFEDTNDKESGNTTEYRGNTIVVTGNAGQFVDMPRMAVDVPRGANNDYIFLVYTTFLGNLDQNIKSKMYCTRSTDGGLTWSSPTKLSESQHVIQGAAIAIDPLNGDVYVALRRFYHKSQENGIVVVKSTDRGSTFSGPMEIATFPTSQFDQPATPNEIIYPDPNDYVPGESIRTNSYPTIAVDDYHRVYVAWSQRNIGPAGEARIVMKTSIGGSSWSTFPMDINPPGSAHRGHEFMPQMAFGAGKLTLVWYDQRFDQTALDLGFEHWIGDWITNSWGDVLRHTIDVWAAQFNPTDYADTNQWSYTQVSRYLHSLLVDEYGDVILYGGYPYIYPVQFNCLNYPMFKGGTLPFMGDYIAIAASPTIILNDSGSWVFNTEYSDNPVFHAAWTDNRDVRPPAGLFDWTQYTPADSFQDPDYISPGRTNCSAGGNRPAIRNQNIYTAKLSWGIIAGSPANEKSLDLSVPRAFVVFVQNNTELFRRVRMTITDQPLNGTASFFQFDSLDEIFVTIAPFSTVSRQVFMQSTDPSDSARIDIVEVDALGDDIEGGLTGYVIINGDPSNAGVSGGNETHQPQFSNPNIVNWVVNPNIVNPNIVNPNIVNPNIVNPNIVNPNIVNPNIVNEPINPNIVNPNIVNPNIVNPNIVNPNIVNPNIVNPNIVNPNIVNPNIVNPNIVNTSLPGGANEVPVFDVMWTVTNEGNTATTYTLDTVAEKAPPEGIYTQLLIYRVHKTPSIAGSVLSSSSPDYDECTLYEEPHHELILNILNPNIVNPNIVNLGTVNPNIVNPNIVNESINNATFALGPGEEAIIDLRVLDTEGITQVQGLVSSQDQFSIQTFDFSEFIYSIGFVVTSMAVDSDDAAAGKRTPKGAATDLYIVSSDPPDGVVGQLYESYMTAFGGTAPYNYTWSLNSGELPLGLNISTGTSPDPQTEGALGIISGTPLTAGTYVFMVQVTDDNDPLHVDTQLFSATIFTGSIPDTPVITTTSLPSGVKGTWYGATIDVAGGDPPFTFSWAPNGTSTPEADGLMLDPTNGIITGIPSAATSYNFDVTVTDRDTQSATVNLDLVILESTGEYFVISGTVYDGVGGLLDGVHLYGLPNSPVTDSYGYYEDYVPEGWSGTVIPFKLNFSFTPDSRVYDQVQADQLGHDYNQQEWYATQSDVVRVTDMVVDSSGNAYISGVGNTGAYVAKFGNTGTFQWDFRYGSTAEDLFYGLCVDPDGNVYATGDVNQNILTVKYDPDGNFEWSDEYDSGYDDDEGLDIAIDALGNFYVSGSVGTATPDIPDACTIKYEQSGGTITRKWMNIYDDGDHDYGLKIAIDPEGKIIVAGYNASPPYTTHDDYFIIKYDTYGTEEWSLRYDGGISQDYLHDLFVDAAGNVYVTGRKETATGADYLTAKFDSSGAFQWKAEYDGANHYDDWANAITVDAYGYVYVTGRSGEYLCADPYVCDDYATIKYNPNGTPVWTARYDGPPGFDHDVAEDIEVDPLGNVYVTGKSVGIDGSFDFATLIYDSAGVKIWEGRYNNNSRNDEAQQIELDPEGNIFVSGPTGADLLILKYSQSFPTTLSITTDALPNGVQGIAYNAVLEAFGGTGVYDWSIIGTLPDGLYIDTLNGIIFGTPTTAGTFSFTVEVTSGALTDSRPLSIIISTAPASQVGLTGPGSVAAGVVSGPLTLTSQNSLGDPTNVTADTVFDLTSDTSGTATFYSDAGGTSVITQVTITNGTNNATFYYKDNAVGTPTVTASWASGGSDLGSDTHLISVTAPPTVTISGTVNTGAGSGTGTMSIMTLEGVLMDGFPGTPVLTQLDGTYSAEVPYGWNGTVTPIKADYIFEPISKTYVDVISNQLDQDYEGVEGWITRYHNDSATNLDLGMKIATDLSGNPYVTGMTDSSPSGLEDFDTITFKLDPNDGSIIWQTLFDQYQDNPMDIGVFRKAGVDDHIFVAAFPYSGSYNNDFATLMYLGSTGGEDWRYIFDYSTVGHEDEVNDLAVDAWGDVYVTGMSDSDPGLYDRSWDYATIKYDGDTGAELWVARYEGANDDVPLDVVVDALGNVYVTGYSNNGTDDDFRTIKYDRDGNEVWNQAYDSTNGDDRGYELALDPAGYLYVSGQMASAGTLQDFGVVKYDLDGNFVWATTYNNDLRDLDDIPEDMAIDGAGNIYVTGRSDIGGGVYDILTVKFIDQGPNAVFGWRDIYDGPLGDTDSPAGIAIDPHNHIYVTGKSSNLDGFNDYVTLKYENTGSNSYTTVWTRRYDGEYGNDNPYDIALCTFGNIYLTGESYGDGTSLDFATIKYTQFFDSLVITSTTFQDGVAGSPYAAFLEAFGGSGSRTWSHTIGTLPPGLALDASTAIISGSPTTPGTYNFTVQVTDGSLSDTQSFSITVQLPPVGSASQVELIGPGSVEVGTVSSALTLTSQDSLGTPVNVADDTVFDLTSTSGGTFNFYSDSGGINEISQATIASETSGITFYYKDTEVNLQTVTAEYNSGPVDLGNSTHGITVTAPPTFPEINIKVGATDIGDGGGYDFGSQTVGSNTDVAFTIENLGDANLTISLPLTITGIDANQFSVQAQPSSPIIPSVNGAFTIRFNPTTEGAKTASISITNNDADENPYDITLIGTAVLTDPFTQVLTGNIVTDTIDSQGFAWGDYDNDGDLDLFVANSARNSLYRNEGSGTFTKIASGAIVTDNDDSNACCWGDYNNDGYLDLFVANDNANNYLYRNDGGGNFTSISSSPVVTHSINTNASCWGDYDNDGDLDLFVIGVNPEDKGLYRNDGGDNFTQITSGEIVAVSIRDGSGCSWVDQDGDGDLELLVTTNDNYIYLFHNEGGGNFTAYVLVDTFTPDHKHSSKAFSWGDYNNDGHIDLFIANAGGENNLLYRNNGIPGFTQQTSGSIVEDGGNSYGCSWGDYDNDGDLDLYVVNTDEENFLYNNDGTGSFTKVTTGVILNELSEKAFACSLRDIDEDGDLDLFVTTKDSGFTNYLFLNNGNTNNWVTIKCVGTSTNHSGIGAKVKVLSTIDSSPVWQMREIFGGTSSQNSLNAEFGLGDATIVDTITVNWPSGQIQILTDVAINQFLPINEPIIIPAPEVLSVDPTSGTTDTDSLIVTISGSYFVDGATTELHFNDTDNSTATNTNFISASELQGIFDLTGVTTNLGEAWDVKVTNPDAQFHTGEDLFTIYLPDPTVTGITPPSGVNTSPASVTIAGTNFVTSVPADVRLSKLPGPEIITGMSVSVDSDTQITCNFDLTGATPGAWDVIVGFPTVTENPGIMSGGFSVVTGGGEATQVELTGPAKVGGGFISDTFTLTSQDDLGQIADVLGNTNFTLSSDSSGISTFFSDPEGTTPITQATIPASQHSVTFYYMDHTPGTPTVTATWTSGGSDLGSDDQQMTVWTVVGQIAFTSDRDGNEEIYVMNADGSGQIRLTDNAEYDRYPRWSSDGSKIVFQSTRDSNTEIYVMNADGSHQTNLTNHSSADGQPDWSPDRGKIVFTSSRDGTDIYELYVMNADGTSQTRLTNNSAGCWNASWSPDGNKIAFSINLGGGDSDIYVINANGTGQTQLTNDPASDTAPEWSPDGTKIAFYSNRSGNGDIFVMDADGSDQTNLTNISGADSMHSWSPDGSKIVFMSDRIGNRQLYVMNADGSGQTRLTNNSDDDTYTSWGGAKIAFESHREGNWEIYIMNADGTGLTNLTNGTFSDRDSSWSPDGSRIAFYSTRHGNEEIYVMDADGTNVTRLTNDLALDAKPCWSPDGNRIAFYSTRDGNEEIYAMDADGINVTRLTNHGEVDKDPNWSPDGNKIVYTTGEGGDQDICIMNTDGSWRVVLTDNLIDDRDPSWSPDGSKIVFVSDRAGGNDDIYVMDADGSNVTRLTDHVHVDQEPNWSPNGAKIVFTRDETGFNWEIYIMNSDGTDQTNLTEHSMDDMYPSWRSQPYKPETIEFVTKWGSLGTANGEFDQPSGIAVDSSGYVYVTDRYNHRVQKFTSAGGFVSKWGTSGTGDSQFNYPSGIAVDSFDNVYVTDTENHRVQKFTSSGGFITKWGTSGTGDSQFNLPGEIAADSSGNVYVADTYNHRVQKFTSSGGFITKWGTSGTGDSQFNAPWGIAVDSSNNVYVTDGGNYRVQKFTSAGGFLGWWGRDNMGFTGWHDPDSGRTGSQGTGDGEFNILGGIAADSSGYVYVADTYYHRIQKFTSGGGFITKWGTYGTGDGQLNNPWKIEVDSSGYVYVTERSNHRVQKFR